jgi:MscS family membrane protein
MEGFGEKFAGMIAPIVLLAVSLLVCRFVPRALEKKDAGSRARLWAEGAIPPLMYLLVVIAVCSLLQAVFTAFFAGGPLEAETPDKVFQAIADRIIRIAAVLFIGWAVIGANRRSNFFVPYGRQDADISRQALLRFVSGLLNIVVAAFIVVLIVTEFGYNVTGLITGLGLGGLTFALAAKDAAANFFGGAIIVTERPFEIGDYIQTDLVEGTVIDINMRATTLRNTIGAKTVVPNSALSGNAITNLTREMKRRRIEFDLVFEYGAPPDEIAAFIDATRAMLAADHEISREDQAARVYDISPKGISVKIYCYAKKPATPEYLRIRERLVYALMELAEKHSLRFAASLL